MTKEKNNKANKVSKELESIIEKVEKLTVLQLSELVSALEDKFGVTAQAPMAVAAPNGPSAGAQEDKPEEKDEFNVVLSGLGEKKIDVIKAIRTIKPDLGLKEAKGLVESIPQTVLENAKKDEAEEAKSKLESAGAQVELK